MSGPLCHLVCSLQTERYSAEDTLYQNLTPEGKLYPTLYNLHYNWSITQVASNSLDKVYTQSQSRSDTDVDVGLEERSKRSKGESGAEVQSDRVRLSGKRARGGC